MRLRQQLGMMTPEVLPEPTHYPDGRKVSRPSGRPGLLERLIPLPDVLSSGEQDTIRQQAILKFGAGLLAGKGLADALGDVDIPGMMTQALQLQELEKARQNEASLANVMLGAGGIEDPFERLASLISNPELLRNPAAKGLIGPLSNALNVLKPTAGKTNRVLRPVEETGPDGRTRLRLKWFDRDTNEVIDTGQNAPTPVDPMQAWLRPTDTQRAAGAMGANMAASHLGMRQIETQHPEAVNEVAAMVRSGRIAGSVPVIGPALDEAIRAAKAPVLSKDARQLLAHINSFIAAAAPERGGKQLTMAEMRLILEEFLPDLGDDPATAKVKVENRLKRIRESRIKAATTWEDAIRAFGITDAQLFGENDNPSDDPEDDLP